MMEPPPPFAKAQAVFAIESELGATSLNSRVLLSGEARRFWIDLGHSGS